MKDIETRANLEQLMTAFYKRLLQDSSISYIFTDVAKIDLEAHLPHIVDFWEQSLFGNNGYRKNVMQVHLDLNAKEKFTQKHFETWLTHFEATVNKLFSGENAEKIKTRAVSIATVMQIKMHNQ
jgi:hemoglobin